MKPELSKRSDYWIERHRYYELKHFCLQFPIWKKTRAALDGPTAFKFTNMPPIKTGEHSDPTAITAELRAYYSDRINMLRNVAKDTDALYGDYILYGVTNGVSYDIMNARSIMPMSRDEYYNLYRRFFWLLSRARG